MGKSHEAISVLIALPFVVALWKENVLNATHPHVFLGAVAVGSLFPDVDTVVCLIAAYSLTFTFVIGWCNKLSNGKRNI